jgi:hypothetical protein
LSPLFSYDPQANGIKCNLGDLNHTIYTAPISDKGLNHKPDYVDFLIVDSEAMYSIALSELQLKKGQINYVAFNDGRTIGQLDYTASSSLEETRKKPFQSPKSDDNSQDEPKQKTTKDELPTDIQPDKIEELIHQMSNIREALNDLSDSITNISTRLDEQKATTSLEVQTILKGIDTLKERSTTPLPSIPTPVKDDAYIKIQKIHLWLSGGALIVGVLLGALIF